MFSKGGSLLLLWLSELLEWDGTLLVFELSIDDSLLLFILWLGAVIVLSELDSEPVLLLAELEENDELDC